MRLGFIGTGAMAGAIARGIRSSGDDTTSFVFFNVNVASAQRLAEETSGRTVQKMAHLTRECDMIILGVKPHVQKLILQQLASSFSHDFLPTLISIAAGRTINDIFQDLVEFGVEAVPPIVRVMPNVNAQIGLSMSAICFSPDVDEKERQQASAIFSSIGECMELPESLFGVFTAMAGSSPAWFFQIVDDLAKAGVKHGMSKYQALIAATQAMLGSARQLQISLNEGQSPSSLIDKVCSPGGTTIAGLLAAQEAGLSTSIVKAVDATIAKDKDLR